MRNLIFIALLWTAGPMLLMGGVLAVLAHRRRSRSPSLALSLALFAGLLVAGIVSIFAADVFWGPVSPSFTDPAVVIIEPGSSPWEVAHTLQKAGVVTDASDLVRAAQLTGRDRRLQAGRYHFPGAQGVLEVLNRLSNGSTNDELVTIPEGLRAWQVAGIVARQADVDSAAFMQLVSDSTFIASVLAPEPGRPLPATLEGYLLPETYNIWYRMPAEEVAGLMVGLFNHLWQRELAARAGELGMSRHQVVTLASIIEREAATAEERPIVSAVFHNRLKRGMRLESCATVLYALGRYKPRLFERDLQVDSPYNTYRHAGLPPGPIANPGAASLRAAVSPAAEPYLYFVARGDGTHTFSRTYAEHLRAKAEHASGAGVLVGGRAAQEAKGGGGEG